MLSEWDAEGRLEHEAARSLQRLLPRLREHSAARSPGGDWAAFEARLRQHFPRLFGLLLRLYGGHYDFFYHLERLLAMAARMALARPAELKALDAQREAEPLWFQSERNLGGVCYVDRFAGTLAGVREHLDYLGELGLTYLHLMPLFPAPEGNNDGGYAVSSYREVDPRLGSMPELAELASELRRRGIMCKTVENDQSFRRESYTQNESAELTARARAASRRPGRTAGTGHY